MVNKDRDGDLIPDGCLIYLVGFIVLSLIINECQEKQIKSAAFDLMQEDPSLSAEEAEEMAEDIIIW